ncbi:MAG: hypothetical protein A4S09_14305 [Proteobacteria bacterium SG_bin7]|nr:MAG: hypothetical protein A4S09_14305 [Proteobacteria bacterium SG_bin7]
MSQIAIDKTKNSKGERFLSFSLGTEEYAIPLLTVKEVIAMPEITPLPHTPSHFLGIMNLRGQVISIVDLRIKLAIKPSNSVETAVIICDLGTLNLGVVVDSVNSVLSPKDNELSGKPAIQSTKNMDYVTGVYRKDKKLILFLDVATSLDVKDYQILEQNKKVA